MVLGAGSNVLFATERFEGCLVHLQCHSARILGDDGDHVLVHVDARFEWDALVDWTLDHGLQGLENLALTPGQAGAAPIQNIGAYGVRIRDVLRIAAVRCYDRQTATFDRLPAALRLWLSRQRLQARTRPTHRHGDQIAAAESRRDQPRLRRAGRGTRRDGRTGIDATQRGRSGSTPAQAQAAGPRRRGQRRQFLQEPRRRCRRRALHWCHAARNMPVFPASTAAERKLSAAWLIEHAGWRGFREGDAAVSAQHALVLVNLGRATGPQLLALARRVAASVQEKFGVVLEPEPRIVGATFQDERPDNGDEPGARRLRGPVTRPRCSACSARARPAPVPRPSAAARSKCCPAT